MPTSSTASTRSLPSQEITATSVLQQPEYLTRAEVPDFLRQYGFPIGRSTIDKLSMPSRGDHAGPKPAGLWGNRHLYKPEAVLRWARARFKSIAA